MNTYRIIERSLKAGCKIWVIMTCAEVRSPYDKNKFRLISQFDLNWRCDLHILEIDNLFNMSKPVVPLRGFRL